jgi:putative ABC transport system ATP-binding protein
VTAVPQVSLEGAGKSYESRGRRREVLADLWAEIMPGEFVVLVGRSGSGKSTLLNLIGGLDRPTSGDVRIAGQSLGALDQEGLSRLRRRRIGYVFQFFNLIPTLTVAENLRLPLELIGVNGAPASDRAGRWLTAVGLGGREDDYPDELSGGEQQRVALARALVHEPGLLLADEPTGNLDLATAREVLRLLDDLCRASGTTLIMATHSQEVIGLADRVLTIRDGRLAAVDAGEDP